MMLYIGVHHAPTGTSLSTCLNSIIKTTKYIKKEVLDQALFIDNITLCVQSEETDNKFKVHTVFDLNK